MKPKVLAILLIAVLLIPVTAQGVVPRIITASPALGFDGTTATCTARIVADNLSDRIVARITLYHGDTVVEYWDVNGKGYIFFSDTATVVSGNTYKLSIVYTVNGIQRTTAFVENTCP